MWVWGGRGECERVGVHTCVNLPMKAKVTA